MKAEGVEAYRHYVVDPKFTEDKWVKIVECMPGNRKVVHHIIVFVQPANGGLGRRGAGENGAGEGGQNVARDEDGNSQRGDNNRAEGAAARRRGGPLADNDITGFGFLAGFAPGTRPVITPDGVAQKIPAGSKLVFQMHYTPCGSEQTDRSSVGLMFMDKKDVTHQMSSDQRSYHELKIPAGRCKLHGRGRQELPPRYAGHVVMFPAHAHARQIVPLRAELLRRQARDVARCSRSTISTGRTASCWPNRR